MVPITIGVPVYNGADLLDESLACLARQTFGDFKVLIFDNASTDGTAEIAQSWTARDGRFHYLRQPSNVGGVTNFRDVLRAAESPWFTWRADDDLSADDYVETLYRLADAFAGLQTGRFDHSLVRSRRRPAARDAGAGDRGRDGDSRTFAGAVRQPQLLVLRPLGPRDGAEGLPVGDRPLSLRVRLRPFDALRTDHRGRRSGDVERPNSFNARAVPRRRRAAKAARRSR